MSNPIIIPIIRKQDTSVSQHTSGANIIAPNISKTKTSTLLSSETNVPSITKKDSNIDIPPIIKSESFNISLFEQSSNIYVKQVTKTDFNLYETNKTLSVFTNIKRIIENIAFNNVYVYKDIYSQETNIISGDLATKIKLILDEDNMINLGTIVLQAVYNEYYPELFKLGTQYISRFKDIQPVGVPPFLFYDKYEHKFSGTINVTSPFTFRIIFDSTYYVTINVNVSVREINY